MSLAKSIAWMALGVLGVMLGILTLFAIVWVITLPLAGLHQPIEHGEYTGQVIDYTHQRGIIFKTNDLTTKTNDRSSAREDWCVPDNNPELVEKVRSIDEGQQVKIEYWSPLWVWVDHCGNPNKLIKSIEVVNATA